MVGDHNGHVGLGVKCAKEVQFHLSASFGFAAADLFTTLDLSCDTPQVSSVSVSSSMDSSS